MRIIYSPQRSDTNIEYQIDGEKITVIMGDVSDVFDFTGTPDGVMEEVETTLPVNPIINAERENGELTVTLLRLYGFDEKELFEHA